MLGVEVNVIPKVDREHPVVNMNEPLIPHDAAMFKDRTRRDYVASLNHQERIARGFNGRVRASLCGSDEN
jgi:hypothetical protein